MAPLGQQKEIKAAMENALIVNRGIISYHTEGIGWSPLVEGWISLNIDLYVPHYTSTVGGGSLIRGPLGDWITDMHP